MFVYLINFVCLVNFSLAFEYVFCHLDCYFLCLFAFIFAKGDYKRAELLLLSKNMLSQVIAWIAICL